MIVVSPWSKGGWVCSEVFDHTSLIRFMEKRFARRDDGLIEKNITAWRRTVCGDLTSAFDFRRPNADIVELPGVARYEPQDRERHDDYVPTPPAHQSVPSQEKGLRRARALPYELRAEGSEHSDAFRIDFVNTGKAGVCFQVRSQIGTEGPWTYTVEAGKALHASWDIAKTQGRYDLSVFGPNGFFRQFKGHSSRSSDVDLDVDVRYDNDDLTLTLRVTNQSHSACRVRVTSAYDRHSIVETLQRGRGFEKRLSLRSSYGWYDFSITSDQDGSFLRRIAGHLENDKDSVSDPALGR